MDLEEPLERFGQLRELGEIIRGPRRLAPHLAEDDLLVDQLDDHLGPPYQPRPTVEVDPQWLRRARHPVLDQLAQEALQLGVERMALDQAKPGGGLTHRPVPPSPVRA